MANNNRNRNNGGTQYDIIKICCYIAFVLGALIIFLNAMLSLFDAGGHTLIMILSFIERIAFLIGVGLAAYRFAAGQGRRSAWFIIFVVALVIFIVGIVLSFF